MADETKKGEDKTTVVEQAPEEKIQSPDGGPILEIPGTGGAVGMRRRAIDPEDPLAPFPCLKVALESGGVLADMKEHLLSHAPSRVVQLALHCMSLLSKLAPVDGGPKDVQSNSNLMMHAATLLAAANVTSIMAAANPGYGEEIDPEVAAKLTAELIGFTAHRAARSIIEDFEKDRQADTAAKAEQKSEPLPDDLTAKVRAAAEKAGLSEADLMAALGRTAGKA